MAVLDPKAQPVDPSVDPGYPQPPAEPSRPSTFRPAEVSIS